MKIDDDEGQEEVGDDEIGSERSHDMEVVGKQ